MNKTFKHEELKKSESEDNVCNFIKFGRMIMKQYLSAIILTDIEI